MNKINRKDKIQTIVFLLGLGVATVVLFWIAHRLSAPAARVENKKRPLCVVCKQPAKRKTTAVYVINPDSHWASNLAHPAWLCENCAEPEKISGHCCLLAKAYSSPISTKNGYAALQLFAVIVGIICLVSTFRFGKSLLWDRCRVIPTADSRKSVLAIISLVLGILGCFTLGLTAIPGLIIGTVALYDISHSEGQLRGRWFALTGILLSSFWLCMVSYLIILST